jgi:hypothetical protein
LAVRWSAFLALPSGWQPQRGDPVNAIVNYAYAALESEIRIKAICDGYDPTIGRPREKSPVGTQGGARSGSRGNLASGNVVNRLEI